jgi:hypothetical protein
MLEKGTVMLVMMMMIMEVSRTVTTTAMATALDGGLQKDEVYPWTP